MMDVYILLLCLTGIFAEVNGLEPSFDVPVINVTVQEGDTAILPCSVDSLGKHKVVWTDQWSTLLTLDDRRIIDDPRISIERPYIRDWNLHIRKTTYNDRGEYVCQINTSPVKTKTVMLFVLVPSKIIDELSSRDQIAREGETVTLVCNVTGVPTPDVTWYKLPSEGSQNKERIGKTGEVLNIYNVSRYCDGTYECVAYNNVDPAVTRQIKVFVEFAPEVSLPTKRIGQYPGRETILDCEITAYPHAVMYWQKNGREIGFFNKEKYQVELYSGNDESTRKTLSLRVRDIQQDDYGEYICYAENKIGKDEEAMLLYDYSIHTKYKSTTKGPHLIEPTPRVISNISISQQAGGRNTGNPWSKPLTEGPDWQAGTGRGMSNRPYMPGEERAALESLGGAGGQHVTLISVLHAVSLIITLVLARHL